MYSKLRQKLNNNSFAEPNSSNNLISVVDKFNVKVEPLVEEYKSFIEKELIPINNIPLVQMLYHLIKDDVAVDTIKKLDYTKKVIEHVREIFDFKDVTYRSLQPNTAYNWHKDTGKVCIHIPLITNLGCRFVYEDINYYMPANGNLYKVVNEDFHTFVNAGKLPRVHLTFENL